MTGCRFNMDVEMEEKSGLKVVNLTKGRVAANYPQAVGNGADRYGNYLA